MGAETFSNAIHDFRRHTIYKDPPAEPMSCVVGDLNNDGVPEFVIETRNPEQLHWFGRTSGGAWEPHLIDDTFPNISGGGVLVDLTGNGRLDLIASTSDRGNHIYWWGGRPIPRSGGHAGTCSSSPPAALTTCCWRT